jgi:hypothetical protein
MTALFRRRRLFLRLCANSHEKHKHPENHQAYARINIHVDVQGVLPVHFRVPGHETENGYDQAKDRK